MELVGGGGEPQPVAVLGAGLLPALGLDVTTVSRTSPSVAAISGAWKTDPARP